MAGYGRKPDAQSQEGRRRGAGDGRGAAQGGRPSPAPSSLRTTGALLASLAAPGRPQLSVPPVRV